MKRFTRRPRQANGPWNAVVMLTSVNRRDNPRSKLLLIDGQRHSELLEAIAASHLGAPYLVLTGDDAAEVLAILERERQRRRSP